jgi:hypothetical protein
MEGVQHEKIQPRGSSEAKFNVHKQPEFCRLTREGIERPATVRKRSVAWRGRTASPLRLDLRERDIYRRKPFVCSIQT